MTFNPTPFRQQWIYLVWRKTTWNIIETFSIYHVQIPIESILLLMHFIISHSVLPPICVPCTFPFIKSLCTYDIPSHIWHAMHLILSSLDSCFIWYNAKEHQFVMVSYDVRHSIVVWQRDEHKKKSILSKFLLVFLSESISLHGISISSSFAIYIYTQLPLSSIEHRTGHGSE